MCTHNTLGYGADMTVEDDSSRTTICSFPTTVFSSRDKLNSVQHENLSLKFPIYMLMIRENISDLTLNYLGSTKILSLQD